MGGKPPAQVPLTSAVVIRGLFPATGQAQTRKCFPACGPMLDSRAQRMAATKTRIRARENILPIIYLDSRENFGVPKPWEPERPLVRVNAG